METPGFACDTSESAEVVLNQGRIVSPEMNAARAEALAVSKRDRRWSEAIVRRMVGTPSSSLSLPTLKEVEANAHLGALTTSMRVAWQIAAVAGLIPAEECDRLIELQLETISRERRKHGFSQQTAETLGEMQAEYRNHLDIRRGMVVPG